MRDPRSDPLAELDAPEDATVRARRALSDDAGRRSRGARGARAALGALAGLVPTVALLVGLIWGGFWLLTDPDTPLAPEWNPTVPLDLSRPATPLTGFKLRRAVTAEGSCHAALATAAEFEPLPPLEAEGRCGIPMRVRLRAVAGAVVPPVETACGTALRLTAWQRHTVPEASRILGAPVARLSHQGSYNCRAIRGGDSMSSHATADAIDIRSVVLADDRRVPILGNWEGQSPEARFWRALRDGACDWFGTVLGPDFDPNHADHLHLQSSGRGACR